ncbi:transglycosylase SLT domain-containing protein [candidate division KSB1 bacterium]|nr:transglycosylase SLT domain-containing protein [candidate division KSB1 bacterium]
MQKILIAFIFTIGLCGLGFKIDSETDSMREIENYVTWFHRNVSAKQLRKALKFVPLVVHWSKERGIDPLLTAIIISFESSWRPDIPGKIGEKGLMQVKNPMAKGIDLEDPSGQIEAGTKILKHCLNKCEDIAGALTCYATRKGRCKRGYAGLQKRLDAYQAAIERHREK